MAAAHYIPAKRLNLAFVYLGFTDTWGHDHCRLEPSLLAFRPLPPG